MNDISIPEEELISVIFKSRGHKVMLDSDLAQLYGVETKVPNQAVKKKCGSVSKRFHVSTDGGRTEQLKISFNQLEQKARALLNHK